MATTVPPSHNRDPSISVLDRDLDSAYSLPPQPGERPQFVGYTFPPQYASSEPYAFPPRRSSVPPSVSALPPVVSAPRPKSSHSDAQKQFGVSPTLTDPFATGQRSPETADCVSPRTVSLSPSPLTTPHLPSATSSGRPGGDGSSSPLLSPGARLGPGMGGAAHNRVASDLLHVPMLEPNPTENESAPIQKKAPPPPGVNPRRGHAHRRSGAISSSDVWSLMNQSALSLPAPSSTGGSPNDGSSGDAASKDASGASPGVSPLFSWSAPVSPECTTGSHSGVDSDSKSGRRVSFIENVEVIPRPTSSGTGSTSVGTVAEHGGVDNDSASTSPVSFNSSIETIPCPSRRPHNRTRSNSQTLAQPTAALRAHSDRPSTAGAILTSIQTKPSETDIPPVPPLPANFLPSRNSSPERSPELSPLAHPSPKKAHKKAKSDSSPSPMFTEFRTYDTDALSDNTSSSPRKQKKKYQRKGKKHIKTWAGSILGKGKLRHSKRQRKSKRAPTPPLVRSEPAAPGENEWVATSWNESYVLMPADTSPVLESPRGTSSGSSDRPLIDLDAALGPFMTPIETTTGFAAARRKMHSAASRGNVGYFHRRSESMPEMQLFALKEDEDRPMEDVFEEDDEEDDEEGGDEEEEEDVSTSEEESSTDDDEEGQMSGGDGLGIGLRTDGETKWSAKTDVDVSHTGVDDKRLSNGTITALAVSSTDLARPTQESTEHPPSPRRKAAPADIITSAHSSTSTVTASTSTVTGPATLEPPALEQPALGLPLDSPSTFVTASSNLNTPNQTDFPDDTSNAFDPYRDYLGEPGPEMRLSSDDIPSLTSSSSTMTMSAVYSGMPSTPSVNDMVTPPSFSSEKPKKSKSKRWSRVWGFWKSK